MSNQANKINEKMRTSETGKKGSVAPLEKDYAHYPPVPLAKVKPAAHKKTEKNHMESSNSLPSPENDTTKEKGKAINGSRKIVNEVDESYSDGSGGGFEATEQVTD